MNSIEYVDTDVVDDMKYFRIGIMQGHEMSVIYFLEATTTIQDREMARELEDIDV